MPVAANRRSYVAEPRAGANTSQTSSGTRGAPATPRPACRAAWLGVDAQRRQARELEAHALEREVERRAHALGGQLRVERRLRAGRALGLAQRWVARPPRKRSASRLQ